MYLEVSGVSKRELGGMREKLKSREEDMMRDTGWAYLGLLEYVRFNPDFNPAGNAS